tara:strand:- start:130 stop:255 length:126 start_codon:yes stop_codon:yes gene_type:complete
MNTSIKISKVHKEMLDAAAKRMRIKPEALLEELIQVKYNQK